LSPAGKRPLTGSKTYYFPGIRVFTGSKKWRFPSKRDNTGSKNHHFPGIGVLTGSKIFTQHIENKQIKYFSCDFHRQNPPFY